MWNINEETARYLDSAEQLINRIREQASSMSSTKLQTKNQLADLVISHYLNALDGQVKQRSPITVFDELYCTKACSSFYADKESKVAHLSAEQHRLQIEIRKLANNVLTKSADSIETGVKKLAECYSIELSELEKSLSLINGEGANVDTDLIDIAYQNFDTLALDKYCCYKQNRKTNWLSNWIQTYQLRNIGPFKQHELEFLDRFYIEIEKLSKCPYWEDQAVSAREFVYVRNSVREQIQHVEKTKKMTISVVKSTQNLLDQQKQIEAQIDTLKTKHAPREMIEAFVNQCKIRELMIFIYCIDIQHWNSSRLLKVTIKSELISSIQERLDELQSTVQYFADLLNEFAWLYPIVLQQYQYNTIVGSGETIHFPVEIKYIFIKAYQGMSELFAQVITECNKVVCSYRSASLEGWVSRIVQSQSRISSWPQLVGPSSYGLFSNSKVISATWNNNEPYSSLLTPYKSLLKELHALLNSRSEEQ